MHGSAASKMADGHGKYGVERRVGGGTVRVEDTVAEEVPVALVYNGFSHAVMMATPQDLEDFALGFSLSEGIAGEVRDILDIEVIEHAQGCEVQMQLAGPRFACLRERRRAMVGRTGCGICGVESLEQLAKRPVANIAGAGVLEAGALLRAQAELQSMQHLFDLTGAVHAAAWCGFDGKVELVREDVGRHNALDKLIGAVATRRMSFADGFVLMTSRASYEIVQKAAAVGIAVVAAVSAPTGMAVRMAEEAGLTLIGFARGERHSIYSHPERVH
ncbi:MAG TPA: formate dehydrogenase accessory sulfurtransferase FdhD [Aromatoleum sp.]|uniref:formate dehydrogenase accessory sulfurtransferase FdhD n=1 Tax=Aromatoleum sp. TaxID=2307007 RepID=UPI002B491F53|nr:formate dehydrogenase accessory sulfurtransferase FdhD [Aromatoleum sp.]HJV24860.1 formate dehydrogenase accessory sulfurtransferase FdhD [Aromatoleum sp.]